MLIKKKQKIFLIHGEQIQYFSEEGRIEEEGIDIFFQNSELFQSFRSSKIEGLFLIGAPYIYTYEQKTIQLDKKELPILDEQTLGFCSLLPPQRKCVYSYPLSGDRAITLHSHLTDQGHDLLEKMKRGKLKFSWKPLTPLLVENYLEGLEQEEFREKMFKLNFWGEGIQFSSERGKKQICHLTFEKGVNRDYFVKNSFLQFGEEIPEEFPHNFCFQQGESLPQEILDTLFHSSFVKKRKRAKGVFWQGKKQWNFSLGKINPVWGMVAGTLLLFLWFLGVDHKLEEQREVKVKLDKKIRYLTTLSEGLEKIRSMQANYFKEDSLQKALQEYQINPIELLEKMFVFFPKRSWLNDFSIQGNTLKIELLDATPEASLSFLEELKKEYKIRLIKSEEIKLGGKKVRKYFLHGNLYSWGNEKPKGGNNDRDLD